MVTRCLQVTMSFNKTWRTCAAARTTEIGAARPAKSAVRESHNWRGNPITILGGNYRSHSTIYPFDVKCEGNMDPLDFMAEGFRLVNYDNAPRFIV